MALHRDHKSGQGTPDSLRKSMYYSIKEVGAQVDLGDNGVLNWVRELGMRVKRSRNRRAFTAKQIGLLVVMRHLVDHGMSAHQAAQFLRRGGKVHLGTLDEKTAMRLVRMYEHQKVLLTVEGIDDVSKG